MKKESSKFKKFIFGLLAAIVCISVISGSVMIIRAAVIDEENSVHVKDTDIEESTLIIGSHLIYLGSMTDELYKLATASQNASGQFNIYYKSELAGGTWFDITDAGSIADIISEGVPVAAEVIEKLNMTHHTKSDGITYDLVKKSSVCIFDVTDPYNIEGLDELSPIKLQYDTISGRDADSLSDTDKRNLQLIRELYGAKVESEDTKTADKKIQALQSYYEILVRDGAEPEMSAMVQKIQGKVDSERRFYVMSLLEEQYLEDLLKSVNRNKKFEKGDVDLTLKGGQNNLLDKILNSFSGENGEAQSEEGDAEEEVADSMKLDGFAIDSELVSAISNAISNCETACNEASLNRLLEGSNVISSAQYENSIKLCEAALSGNYAECDGFTQNLIYLDRILAATIKESDKEREFIETQLFGTADSAFHTSLGSGASSEYMKLPATAAAATRSATLKKQKNETEGIRSELQFIIQAALDRMSAPEGIEYINSLIAGVEGHKGIIRGDAYKDYAMSCADAYNEWLNGKLTALYAAVGGSDMEALLSEKQELQEKRLEALDSNNLKEASRFEALIEATDLKLADAEKKLSNILSSESADAKEKAQAAAGLSSGSASASIVELRDSALADIGENNFSGVDSKIESIGALAKVNADMSLAALKTIYKEVAKKLLTDNVALNELTEISEKVEEVTADNMNYFLGKVTEDQVTQALADVIAQKGLGGSEKSLTGSDGKSEGGNSGESENGSDLDRNRGIISKEIKDLLDGLKDDELAGVLAGMSMYAEQTGADDIERIVSAYAKKAASNGNPYIYLGISSDDNGDYIAADTLAQITGYRYIFSDSQMTVTLQKGANFYLFKAFSKEVARPSDSVEEMPVAAGFQRVVYVGADYSKSVFGIDARRLEGSEYMVALSDDAVSLAGDFYAQLMELSY